MDALGPAWRWSVGNPCPRKAGFLTGMAPAVALGVILHGAVSTPCGAHTRPMGPSLLVVVTAQEKKDIPSETEQEEIHKVVKEMFRAEYSRRSSKDRISLAAKLFNQARETKDDPRSQYVLLREAALLASEGGDLKLAMEVASEIEERFKVDGVAFKNDLLDTIGRSARDAAILEGLTTAFMAIAGQAVSEDRYETAVDLLKTASRHARRSRNKELAAEVESMLEDAESLRKSADEAAKARKTLSTRPQDGPANFKVGWYLCAIKGNWPEGLPYLAKGSREEIKKAALADLINPVDPARTVELGDLWWEAAEKARGSEQSTLKERAVLWYQQAVGKVTGIARLKVEKRLKKERDERLKREGWVDLTDSRLYGRGGGTGGPLKATAADSFLRLKLKAMPKGEFDAFYVRVHFGSGNTGKILIDLGVDSNVVYVMNGSIWCKSPNGTDFMVKGAKLERYTVSGHLSDGEYVIYLDGKEVGRSKTEHKTIPFLALSTSRGEFTFEEIRIRRRQ